MASPTRIGLWLAIAGCLGLGAPTATAATAAIQVSEAFQLLAMIAPERTLELAAGDYDLLNGALHLAALQRKGVAGGQQLSLSPYLDFAYRDQGGSLLLIHDVPGLRLAGPARGVARLEASSSLSVRIADSPGLGLQDLTFGRRRDPPTFMGNADGAGGTLELEIASSREVVLERLSLFQTVGVVRLQDTAARIRRLDSEGSSGLQVAGRSVVELTGVDADTGESDWLCADAEANLRLADATFSTAWEDRHEGLRSFLECLSRGRTLFTDVRLLDRITGRRIAAFAGPQPPPAPEDPSARRIPLVMLRTSPEPGDDGEYELRYRLPDGRTFAAGKSGDDGRYGPDPETFSARYLGGEDDPILVTWDDYSQGSADNQSTFYHLVAPGKAARLLLFGERPIAGHYQLERGLHGSVAFEYDHKLLTMRRWQKTWERISGDPDSELDELVFRDTRKLAEIVYRFTGQELELASQEEFLRLEAGDDFASLSGSWTPSLPHEGPPRPGEWLKPKK